MARERQEDPREVRKIATDGEKTRIISEIRIDGSEIFSSHGI
jgi:hypothetical protein